MQSTPAFAIPRNAACSSGKPAYSKRGALTARNARMRRNPFSRKRPACLRVYACPTCCGWHLTHTLQLSA